MDTSISKKHYERIKRKVESGQYGSHDEVLEKALALLDEHDDELAQELAEIKAKVQIGLEQANRGELTPASEVFDELLRRNAERFK